MVCAMRKAGVLSILFVVVLLAVAVIAEVQQAKKVPRVRYLDSLKIQTLPRHSGKVFTNRATSRGKPFTWNTDMLAEDLSILPNSQPSWLILKLMSLSRP